MIIGIFAIDDQGGVGLKGSLPWHDKNDMKWFKTTTSNHIVIMGRTTWESTGFLPNRKNIVLTNKPLVHSNTSVMCGNVCSNTVAIQQNNAEQNVFVIGGANVLLQAKPVLEQLYITRIPGDYSCDTKIDLDNFIWGFNLIKRIDLKTCEVEIYERIFECFSTHTSNWA